MENDLYAASLVSYQNEEETRFRSAADMMNDYTPKNHTMVDYSFEILEEVALDGAWSVVYDMENMQIHFKTKTNRSIRTIDIDAFDFDCAAGALMYDLNRDDEKNINTQFTTYNQLFNQKKFDEAIESNGVDFPEEILELFYAYQMTCKCSVP